MEQSPSSGGMKQSPASGGMKQSPASGGMTTQDTDTTVEIRDNAYWPDEARLADFVEQNARAEQDDRVELADRPVKDDSAFAALYFVS